MSLFQLAVAEAQPGPGTRARARLPRKGETFDELAAGSGVGRTTAWRYVNEGAEAPAGAPGR